MARIALARRLKEKGLELGLGAVGIAPIAPSAHAAFLKEWLRAGRAGEMGWMERTYEARADLRRRFPWAVSAVVAAVPYLPYKDDRRRQADPAVRLEIEAALEGRTARPTPKA